MIAHYIERHRDLAAAHLVEFHTRNLDSADAFSAVSGWVDAVVAAAEVGDNGVKGMMQTIGVQAEPPLSAPDSLRDYLVNSLHFEQNLIPEVTGSDASVLAIDARVLPGMSPKKIHEVARLAPIIARLCRRLSVTTVVDIGAGQGYLSRVLALQFGLNVLAIDGDDVQTCGAARFQDRVKKSTLRSEGESLLRHVTTSLGAGHLAQLGSLIDSFLDEVAATGGSVRERGFVLCGLHACGDLTPTILRMWRELPGARGVAAVGCCYNMLSEATALPSISTCGFPMSVKLRTSNSQLGYTARQLACQSIPRWPENIPAMCKAFYRSLLHLYMVQYGLCDMDAPPPVVGRVRRPAVFTSFEQYADVALPRLGHHMDACQSRQISDFTAKFVDQASNLHRFVAFASLRVRLAPAIESLIALDRVQWLQEQDEAIFAQARRVFDGNISPRNILITAEKKCS